MSRLFHLAICCCLVAVAHAATSDEKPSLSVEIDAAAIGLDPDQGLPVSEVRPGGSGDEMGIRPGDRIVSIGNAVVGSIDQLRNLLEARSVGDEITLTVRRDGAVQTLSGKLVPPPSMGQIYRRMTELRSKLDELERRMQDERPTMDRALADLVAQLRELEAAIPEAAAAFKQYYPKGRFDIDISITISSDVTAEDPVTIEDRSGSSTNPDNAGPPQDDGPPTIPPPRPQP